MVLRGRHNIQSWNYNIIPSNWSVLNLPICGLRAVTNIRDSLRRVLIVSLLATIPSTQFLVKLTHASPSNIDIIKLSARCNGHGSLTMVQVSKICNNDQNFQITVVKIGQVRASVPYPLKYRPFNSVFNVHK